MILNQIQKGTLEEKWFLNLTCNLIYFFLEFKFSHYTSDGGNKEDKPNIETQTELALSPETVSN